MVAKTLPPEARNWCRRKAKKGSPEGKRTSLPISSTALSRCSHSAGSSLSNNHNRIVSIPSRGLFMISARRLRLGPHIRVVGYARG